MANQEKQYRLTYYWSDSIAEYLFVLEVATDERLQHYADVSCGGYEWAQKIAKHYDLEIPKPYKEGMN